VLPDPDDPDELVPADVEEVLDAPDRANRELVQPAERAEIHERVNAAAKGAKAGTEAASRV